jgi:hypothetical protein
MKADLAELVNGGLNNIDGLFNYERPHKSRKRSFEGR